MHLEVLSNDSDNYSRVLWGHINIAMYLPGALNQLISPKWDHFPWPEYSDLYTTHCLVIFSAITLPSLAVFQDNSQILQDSCTLILENVYKKIMTKQRKICHVNIHIFNNFSLLKMHTFR